LDTEIYMIISMTLYKLISLLVGLGLSHMGYKLFMAGVWGNAGGLEAQFQDTKLVVKKAAPGTFFALFGAIVICLTLFKGLELRDHGRTSYSETITDITEDKKNDLPKKPPF